LSSSAFRRDAGRLSCEGLALETLALRFGTPLHVYSRAAVEEAYRGYARAFAAVPHRICYALKANACGGLLKVLAGLGAGADVVSGGELKAALRAGFPPSSIVFSGVGKTDEEIALGVTSRIGEFNAESEEEVARIDRAASAAGTVARMTLRVNPDVDARSHPYVSTGLRDSKFGVELAEAPGVLERARRLPGVRVVGVQCHIGSQITDLSAIGQAAESLSHLARRLLGQGHPLDTIDVGGGLGVDYEGDGAPGPADLAAQVLPALHGLPLRLLLEPGRSLVASAGVLLARVLYVKRRPDRTFVIVDAGMNDLLRPSLYAAFHRIEPVSLRPGPPAPVDVVGPVCEAGDFLARGRPLPPVEPGDLLTVFDTGAYGAAMSSNYNMRLRAAEVLVGGGEARLVRRRESFEDLVRTEV
jgi:diaminopimelate decarboxylase